MKRKRFTEEQISAQLDSADIIIPSCAKTRPF